MVEAQREEASQITKKIEDIPVPVIAPSLLSPPQFADPLPIKDVMIPTLVPRATGSTSLEWLPTPTTPLDYVLKTIKFS